MIAIIDYKAGNLASVKKAFAHLGFPAVVTSDAYEVRKAEKIVLPGVGHFASTQALEQSGLRQAILDRLGGGVCFLGICLGMQWMLEGSQEAPGARGLGLWSGECRRFPAQVKSPHVGWNSLAIEDRGSRLLRGIPRGCFLYFTHSYWAPVIPATAAQAEHGGSFSAVLEEENLFGVQFHPEKSGVWGLKILENFCLI